MRIDRNKQLVVGLAIVGASAAGAAFVACSSSSGVGMGNGGGSGTTAQGACTNQNALTVLFSPAYSAFDGQHMFQVPAVVDGINPSLVTWSVSDSSKVSFQNDPTTGGIMLTTLAAGQVTITAQAGNLCGTSVLNITQASPADWEIGNARYNNGVAIHFGMHGGMADAGVPDGAALADGGMVGPACTNCHGQTATNGPFKDIAHTPEQTGGFSDEELVNIVVNGVVPDGGYFDPAIVPYGRWQDIHRWSDITADEQRGMIVYLRSLTPAPQMGTANFGGRHRDGGMDMGPPGDGPGQGGGQGQGGGPGQGGGNGAPDAGARDAG